LDLHDRSMESAWWPLDGMLAFLRRPRWWLRPLGCMLAAAGLLGALFGLVAWWQWPSPALTRLAWLWHALLALGSAGAAVVAAWFLLLPLLFAWAMADLVTRAQAASGAPPAPAIGWWQATADSLRVLVGTGLGRLLWCLLGIALGLCAGPVGLVVGAWAMALVACEEAVDAALAARGCTAALRLDLMRRHRGELMAGALVAGLLNLALASTLIGWLLWLPALSVGAARLVLRWPEAAVPVLAAGVVHGR
jgi:hypothetical protein